MNLQCNRPLDSAPVSFVIEYDFYKVLRVAVWMDIVTHNFSAQISEVCCFEKKI